MANGPNHEAALVVEDLTKRYSESVTVGPLSFAIGEGELFSLLGPSGCGKSTTLRCIAGFETPTGGAIWLNGERLDQKPPHKRELGLVFQSHALFPHLTVADNVGFGLAIRRVAKEDLRARVDQALELVGLSELGERMPSQISGGQQQRVALARSLILEPPLLLLDEPLSSLDLKLRQQMREELRTLQRKLKQTTVFVTHDQTEALALSDRIAVLSEGRIEQIGTPEEIYCTPASRFVADFIGSSNLFEAELQGRDGDEVWLGLAGGVRLRARAGRVVAGHGPVWALVRPERVRLTLSAEAPPGVNVLSGRVVNAEYLGEDTQVRMDIPGLPPVLVTLKTTREATDILAAGKLYLHVSIDDVYLLAR